MKLLLGIGAFLNDVSTKLSEASAKKKHDRYVKRRDGLRQYIHVAVPNELDGFEKRFEATRAEFEATQELTRWVARPPAWKKEEFQPLATPRMRKSF